MAWYWITGILYMFGLLEKVIWLFVKGFSKCIEYINKK